MGLRVPLHGEMGQEFMEGPRERRLNEELELCGGQRQPMGSFDKALGAGQCHIPSLQTGSSGPRPVGKLASRLFPKPA